MLGHQFAFSAAPVRKVKEVQFGILSPEEIVSTNCFNPGRLLPSGQLTRRWRRGNTESIFGRKD